MAPQWKFATNCDCLFLSFLILLSSTIILLAPFFLSLAELNTPFKAPFTPPVPAEVTIPTTIAETISTSVSAAATTTEAALKSTHTPSIPSTQKTTYEGYTSHNAFNLNRAYNPIWLFNIPSNTPLTSLSIPGTHDSCTSTLTLPSVHQTQIYGLEVQLVAGIRYFDIRARVVGDELLIYDEDEYTGKRYIDVLEAFFAFLDMHPTEMIIMRLKEEGRPINSTTSFGESFKRYTNDNPATAMGCKKHFLAPENGWPLSGIPTLGELRDKVLILQNFDADGESYGIPWLSPLLSIQDKSSISDLGKGLDGKWDSVQASLRTAGNGRGKEKLYLNHLSAAGVNVLPIEVAAGTKDGSVKGMNDRVGEWIGENMDTGIGTGALGVVIMDFPGRELVNAVIGKNPHV